MVNETLLPFNYSTMPIVLGSDIFVPATVFHGLDVWAVGFEDFARVYSRDNRFVDFHTTPGDARTTNQDGLQLRWPHARSVNNRIYVPLRQVSDFFGLSFQVVEIPDSIISERQMHVVRITSGSSINDPTAVGMNRDGIRRGFEEHFAPPPLPPSRPPIIGDDPPPPPQIEEPVELPPDYSDVTVYLSFFDISAGSVEWILGLFDMPETGSHAAFFVSAEDIFLNPGMVRRISGTGHTLGIWLTEGTFEEYLRASAVLFEAAKVRTVIISASDAAEQARETAQAHNLIFWDSTESIVDYEASLSAITATIPRASGARRNLLFSGNEAAATIFPGVYSYLRENIFTVERITETVEPLGAHTIEN